MHFLILGGNGRTGQQVIAHALSRGHTITALVRNPSTVASQDGVTLIQGTPTNRTDVARAFESTTSRIDAVIITLNAPRASDSPFAKSISPPDLMLNCVKNAVQVMRETGVKRLVVLQAFGVGSSYANLNFLMKGVLRWSPMGAQYADHDAVDSFLRREVGMPGEGKDGGKNEGEGGIEWTMVRPAMFKGSERKEVKVYEDGKGAGFMPSVSRESVAVFIVEGCLEGGRWSGKAPVVCE